MTSHLSLELNRPALMCDGNFIGGHWQQALGAARHPVSDPATDRVFTHVPNSGPEDAKAAVDAAQAAFPAWRASSARERAQLLKRWHSLILDN
ncbi:MAG: succinate-semialdehyde dehydrogenase, partial [Gammaproteobacteria bacterium BRH_c0]